MGFKVEFNNILRYDVKEKLEVGKEYSFQKNGSRIYADDIQIWLTKEDWTALGEIMITSQMRKENKITGTFKVVYIYTETESQTITSLFKRMYGWK